MYIRFTVISNFSKLLQRIINLTRGVPGRFHHVRLNREFSRDISMWKVFLDQWNGRSFFLDSAITPSPDLELFTDAAGSIGFGGYFRGKWFQGRWPACMHLSRERGISIEWQELFPIVVACALWYPEFSGKRLQFWCDNESVVAIINQGHSKAPRIMDLVRFLVLISMKHNFFVRARHVAGVNNGIADALSRFQEQRFRQLAPHAAPRPCTIPPSLMTLWGTRFSAMRTALYRVTLDVPTAPGKSGSCLFASRTASSTPAGTFSLPRRAPLFTSRPMWLAQSSTVLSSCISVRSAISMFHPATATPCRVNCCSKKFCAASFASRANTVPFANRLPPSFCWVFAPFYAVG